VNQQGEQQRKRQWPVFTACAFDRPVPAFRGLRKSRRRRVRRGFLRCGGTLASGRIAAGPVRPRACRAVRLRSCHSGDARDPHAGHCIDSHGSDRTVDAGNRRAGGRRPAST
jgi:hypothetical protein